MSNSINGPEGGFNIANVWASKVKKAMEEKTEPSLDKMLETRNPQLESGEYVKDAGHQLMSPWTMKKNTRG